VAGTLDLEVAHPRKG
jgi:hypothetical protein